MPFDYAGGRLKQHSDGSLGETFGATAGSRYSFVRARFTGETTEYQTFAVMRESEIVAADETGRELDPAPVWFGHGRKDGRYKLFFVCCR